MYVMRRGYETANHPTLRSRGNSDIIRDIKRRKKLIRKINAALGNKNEKSKDSKE